MNTGPHKKQKKKEKMENDKPTLLEWTILVLVLLSYYNV